MRWFALVVLIAVMPMPMANAQSVTLGEWLDKAWQAERAVVRLEAAFDYVQRGPQN